MVRVHQELDAAGLTRPRELVQARNDPRVLEQHARDEDRGGALVELVRHPLGQRVGRAGCDSNDVEPRFVEPGELAADRVELTVGRDQAGSPAQVERGEKAQHEGVRVLVERDRAARIAEQRSEPLADTLGLRECALPLVVDRQSGVVPGLEHALAPDVGPGLVRVAGEEQPLGDAERRVVAGELLRRDQSSARTVQRSGKKGLFSVSRRYAAPGEPPVPGRDPIVRSTIFTWW